MFFCTFFLKRSFHFVKVVEMMKMLLHSAKGKIIFMGRGIDRIVTNVVLKLIQATRKWNEGQKYLVKYVEFQEVNEVTDRNRILSSWNNLSTSTGVGGKRGFPPRFFISQYVHIYWGFRIKSSKSCGDATNNNNVLCFPGTKLDIMMLLSNTE